MQGKGIGAEKEKATTGAGGKNLSGVVAVQRSVTLFENIAINPFANVPGEPGSPFEIFQAESLFQPGAVATLDCRAGHRAGRDRWQ